MNPADPWRRVLIIDDEEGIRDVFTKFLNVLGYPADTAVDGKEGLRLLGRADYALVITDLKMPGMSGLEVAAAIRRSRPRTRVMIVSGSAVSEDIERMRRLGVAYLEKPVTLRDFTTAVEGALRTLHRGGPRRGRRPLIA